MDENTTQPEEEHASWTRRWGKIIFLIVAITIILFSAYFAKLTSEYYSGLQDGTLDLASFEDGGLSEVSKDQQVTEVDNFYVSNFQDDPTIGPEDALITIVLFEDFECPFCAQLFPTLRSVIANYSDEVRFVYRDFPLDEIHPNAQKAAEAGQCANDQGAFWTYHDKLYLNQRFLTVTSLKQYARDLNLDGEKFDNCLDTGKYTGEVEADFQDGLKAGVTGTPTMFFNGNRVAGVLSEEGFRQIIDYFKSNQ